MELDWLETFLAVVDRGGFTAASEQLHRSQSRVSAHIAALERDLGVRLIDRTHRPATLTPAGEVFARHAREIVSGVGTARSAVSALRGLDQGAVTLLTTPSIGTTVFPDLLATIAPELPRVRFGLAEHARHDADSRSLGEGVALALLPRLPHPLPAGLRERVLWREPFRALVRADDPLARADGPVTFDRVLCSPLLLCGTSSEGGPEVVRLLAEHGAAIRPRATTDTIGTLVGLVKAGLGIGVVNAVAAGKAESDGLTVLEIDDARLGREVAAYWYDVLLATRVGRTLHAAVLAAMPPGALPVR
ncbi:LysR family transcriptional regulator [Pseudonocardia sp.]|uniref:LysR family transcriptional regulator n=1 Tax=Pseudonocardia sp. TaxID=60912 RepID=UPI003D11CF5C